MREIKFRAFFHTNQDMVFFTFDEIPRIGFMQLHDEMFDPPSL